MPVQISLRPPRGTKDKLPDETFIMREVCEKLRSVFELYGYGEVETPAFENLEVLVAKAGEEVVEQIYTFKDKAGRDLGLRFELTTPIARIVASRLEMPKPLRFYYIQPVWRYEEPQRGRLREFWQAGVELIGVSGPEGDAEVIAVAHHAIRHTGLEQFNLRISHRVIVEDILISSGIPREKLQEAFRILDKLDKRGRDYVVSELSKLGASEASVDRSLEKLLTSGLDIEVSTPTGIESLKYLRSLIEILEDAYNIKVSVDFGIVRGLGYYTGPVFEVKTPLGGEIGSIAGGGRYDDLISSLGGPRIPATGMAIGVERLIEALASEGKTPQAPSPFDAVVIPVGQSLEVLKYAIKIAEMIRNKGSIRSIVEYETGSLSKALEKASKKGATFAIIVGEKEVKLKKANVRNLKRWSETTVDFDEIVNFVALQ
ncbi:MAG: histidine--tRNA ligase [Infirmifilum sp.]|uniref:Histidine--tRNA ligase n=1 Tax=Infirmifilum uzonense TaxID=1550241 RepID=A0A0F7FIY3_9CREN|nr:histidine--tRNA ligase [Infirmifilum uzonense]AKG38897.1 hypothetical protein MA03_06010 [Infirmifilum uzonense]